MYRPLSNTTGSALTDYIVSISYALPNTNLAFLLGVHDCLLYTFLIFS